MFQEAESRFHIVQTAEVEYMQYTCIEQCLQPLATTKGPELNVTGCVSARARKRVVALADLHPAPEVGTIAMVAHAALPSLLAFAWETANPKSIIGFVPTGVLHARFGRHLHSFTTLLTTLYFGFPTRGRDLACALMAAYCHISCIVQRT